MNLHVAEADQALYYCLRVVFLEPQLHQLLVLVPKANIMFAPFFSPPDSQVNTANANAQVDVFQNFTK